MNRSTNIEFNTSNNSSQRIIDLLYNLYDNYFKKLTEGKKGLTLEEVNKVRKKMADDNVRNASDALIELEKQVAELEASLAAAGSEGHGGSAEEGTAQRTFQSCGVFIGGCTRIVVKHYI